MRTGSVVKASALLCYVIAQVGGGALVARVLLLGIAPDVEWLRVPSWAAWLLDVALLLLFGLQHSGMARASFKLRWTRVVSPALERSVYAAASGVVLLALALMWQRVDDGVWWSAPAWLIVVPLAALVGLLLVNLRFDHLGLFGVRQAWASDRPPPPEYLVTTGPYRYIRHPLMACLLLFLWTPPTMTTTLALLSGGMTLYIFLGIILEERDLTQRFHPAYAVYRQRVPALIPWRPPIASP